MENDCLKSGWLNINKPKGVTCVNITSKIKKALSKQSPKIKIGHCGTLDPLADGVLPIAVGDATKLINYAVANTKTYSFTIQFGKSTTTGDAEGKIIETSDYKPSSEEIFKENLIAATKKFIGNIKQKLPAFSAAKINGITFYSLARKGIAPPERIREVEIFSLDMLDFDFGKNTAKFVAKCSKGTYIRVLAEDIAKFLQTVGFVIQLSRLSSGKFDIDDSLDGSLLLEMPFSYDILAHLNTYMHPVEFVLDDIPVIDIDQITFKKLKFGQQIMVNFSNPGVIWLRFEGQICSIGKVLDSKSDNQLNSFKVLRNFM